MDYYNTKTFQHAGGDCWCNNFPISTSPPYSYNPSDFTSVYPSEVFTTSSGISTRRFGLYAQDQIQLPHDVHVLVGGRYQRQKELSKGHLS
jgi:outer membrane receptor protein involved in Fe transport